MILRDMIGKDYDDEDWNHLLNQMPFEELEALNLNAAFKTNKADSIGKPETSETDGPSGFVNFMDTNTFYGTAKYCNETVIGATWNIPLTEQFGETVGEEGLWGDSEGKGKGLVYSGWYAPGANIHRGQFGGRVAEYFSEDPLLSGKMSAAVTKGALKKGVYTYMKHFALNEQETHRGGVNVWCNEQAIREIYLRPFEIAVKEAKATGIMSSFNKIGTKWTGGDYRLLTTILRKEWGFKGTVICDFSTGQSHMNAKQMAYAGGDLNLDSMESKWAKKDNASDVTVLRENAHHILYTIANSCVFNAEVIGYALPTWEVIMFWVDGAILALLAAWGIILVISERKKASV
jgi:beta-glucosidase